MVRSFDAREIDHDALDEMCVEALRAPSAGNSAGVSFVTVARHDVAAYFEVATDPSWRENAPRAPGLMRASAVVAVICSRDAYLARYGESDKQHSRLTRPEDWNVPYWYTDAAMATMALLLLLEEARMDATIWGNFRHDTAVLEFLGAPDDALLFATVLVGHGDGNDRRSSSLDRAVVSRAQRVRRLRRD
jgi:nitroreductase